MKKKSILERVAAVPHTVWMIMFIVAPMIFVLFFAFTDINGNFSFINITRLAQYSNVFLLSIGFALIATVICLLIGYPLAYFLAKTKPSTQKILVLLIMLPMWISLLIRTYSLMALLDNGGLLNSLLNQLGLADINIVGTTQGVILGMIYDFLPYMVLPIYTAITKIDPKCLEAASDLGCNNFKVMTKVIIPMVFIPSISTFYISQKLGAGKFDLIGDTIERLFQNVGTYNVGAAISLVMMILITISVVVMNKFSGNDDDGGIIV